MGVNIWLTYDCNLNCSYCYEKDIKIGMKNKINNNNIDSYLNFIENFLYQRRERLGSAYIVNLHGGEPLLKFDLLKEIVENLKESDKLKDKKILFGVTTNGTLLNDEIIDFLCDNFEYSLTVSIDGNKENHDKYRKFLNGKGSFDLVINNALKILKKRSDVRIRMTFDSSTVKGLCDNIIYLIDLGFKNIVPALNFFDENWDETNTKVIGEQLEKLKCNATYIQNPDVKIGLIESIKAHKPKIHCTGGINSINIAPDGNLYPCTYVVGKEEFKIGNIFDGIDMQKLNSYKKIYKCQNEQCKGCSYYYYCTSGRCKFVNKVITGEFITPSHQICMLSNEEFKLWKNLNKSIL